MSDWLKDIEEVNKTEENKPIEAVDLPEWGVSSESVESTPAPVTDFFEADWASDMITSDEMKALAAKYGKTETEVRNLLNLRGASIETEEEAKAAEDYGVTGEVLPAVKSFAGGLARDVAGTVPAMINSATVGVMWKALRESSDKPEFYDEIENLAEANRGKFQRASEFAIEVATGIAAGKQFAKTVTPALNKFESINKLRGLSKAAGESVASLLGGGNIGRFAGKAAKGAVNLAPTSLATSVVGSVAGYTGARGDYTPEEAATNAAMFAAVPYAGLLGSKALGQIVGRPAGYMAKKISSLRNDLVADLSGAERVIASRAPSEDLLYDLATRTKNFEELTDAEVSGLVGLVSDGKKGQLKAITQELKKQKFSSDEKTLNRRAEEIFIRQEVDRRLQIFGDEFLPQRTAVRKEVFDVNETINEFSQIDDISEMGRFIKNNTFIEKPMKQRLSATLADDALTEEAKLSKVKSSLVTEWLSPRLKALEGVEGAGRGTFNSIDDVRNYILEVERTTGVDHKYMQDLWKTFRTNELMLKQAAGKVKNYRWDRIEQMTNGIIPYSRVADSVDRRWGTNIGYHWTKVLRKMDAFGYAADGLKKEAIAPVVKQLDDFQKALPKKFNDNTLFAHYHEQHPKRFARRAAELGIIDPEEIAEYTAKGGTKLSMDDAISLVFKGDEKAADSFSKFSGEYAKAWDYLLNEAENTFGIKIAKRQAYFRHQTVSPELAFGRITQKFKEIKADLPESMTRDEHRALYKANYNYRQIYDSIKALYNLADHPMPQGYGKTSMAESIEQITEIGKDTITNRLAPNIHSAYRREGTMPDLLREFDPLKVMEGWIANTLRAKYIRTDLAEISKLIPVLTKLGAKDDTAFVKDMIRRAVGVPGDAWFSSNKGKMERVKRIVQEGVNNPEEWEMMITRPEQVQRILSSTLYSNLLSGPMTSVRNLTQIPFVTGTEIGGAYGQKKALQGFGFAAKHMWKSKMQFDDFMYQGKLPPKVRSEIHSDVLRPKGKLDTAEKFAQAYSNKALWFFGKAEIATRLASIGAARGMMSDILAGGADSQSAREFISKGISSPSHRRKLTDTLAKLDEAKLSGDKRSMHEASWKLKDDLEDYLLERTDFNYSKANMSKFAEKLGPLLSSFTRYSTEIQGMAIDKIRSGNAVGGMEQLLYPAVYMYAFSNALQKTAETQEGKNRIEAALGKQSGWVPASSLLGMAGLIEQRPPAADLVIDLFGAATRDKTKMKEAIDDMLNIVPLYTPAVNWVDRFGYRVIMGGSREDMPISSAKKALTKPVIDKLGKDKE